LHWAAWAAYPDVAFDAVLVVSPVGELLQVVPDALVLGVEDVGAVLALLKSYKKGK
jgi:hypothetical protein